MKYLYSKKWATGLTKFLLIAAVLIAGSSSKQAVAEVPYEAAWQSSGHADPCAEAFVHWDEDGEIRTDFDLIQLE